MGFISSILCCSSETTQSKHQWQSNQAPTRSQKALSPAQSNVHSSLSKSSQKMLYPTRTAKSGKKGKEPVVLGNNDEKEDAKGNGEPTSVGSAKKKRHGSGVKTKRRSLTKKDLQEDDEDEDKEYDAMEEEDEVNDDETDEERVDVDDSKDKAAEEVTNEEEKQGVYVYNGETDTSTGGSSYDQRSPQAQGKSSPKVAAGVSKNVNESELTTTVHEGENCSSADDTDIALQQDQSNGESGDYEMAPPYDEEEEFVDLAELQMGQAHAQGYNTLLPPRAPAFNGKKCLVLDLDETLVHSSFTYLRTADFVLPVDIDDQIHNVYVIKRPGVDEFLKRVGALYEVVVFTASVSRYGDPLLDILDKHKTIHHRLFRESCYNYEGNYIKNLSQIGRPLSDIIILDNSPASYIFHPQHAIPISSWFSDTHDNELLDIIPLLEDLSEKSVPDVGKVLDVTI